MSKPAPSTIMQGPLSFDKPKGLDALLLSLLCPPTDSVDIQKLAKRIARISAPASSWLLTLSFAILPAWLWLVRHELLQGHNSEATTVLVLGVIIFLSTDWVSFAAGGTDSARRIGVFTANTKSAYQLSPVMYAVGGTTGQSNMVVKPSHCADGRVGPESHIPVFSSPAYGGGPGCGQVASNSTRSQPAAIPLDSSAAPVDRLVRQVKQRVMKLERVLFGNELTEADLSPDALHSRVQMLCTEVGVPFGGPVGSHARFTVAELDQQLRAIESALGVP